MTLQPLICITPDLSFHLFTTLLFSPSAVRYVDYGYSVGRLDRETLKRRYQQLQQGTRNHNKLRYLLFRGGLERAIYPPNHTNEPGVRGVANIFPDLPWFRLRHSARNKHWLCYVRTTISYLYGYLYVVEEEAGGEKHQSMMGRPKKNTLTICYRIPRQVPTCIACISPTDMSCRYICRSM